MSAKITSLRFARHLLQGVALLLVCSTVFASPAVNVVPKVTSINSRPETWLLVGNSYSYYSCGLNQIVNGLARAAKIPVRRSRLAAVSGSGLGTTNVWELMRPTGVAAWHADQTDGSIKRIDFTKEKIFDVVVLQDNSRGLLHPERSKAIRRAVMRHSTDLAALGIPAALLMTWPRRV